VSTFQSRFKLDTEPVSPICNLGYPRMTSVKRTSLIRTGLLSAVALFVLSACEVPEDSNPQSSALDRPTIAMDLPITLTGIVSTNGQLQADGAVDKLGTTYEVTSSDECSFDGASQGNWMENGYTMTTFLVGLSQAQSCIADLVIGGVTENGASLVNEGVYTIPAADRNSANDPSHLEIQQIGGAYHVWLYFNDNSTLPSDVSTVPTMYITWSTSGTDTTGKFVMSSLPYNEADPGAPTRLRVDFTRSSTVDTNTVYMGFANDHPHGVNGFKVVVSETAGTDSATYNASGLMELAKQPLESTLPSAEVTAGSFSAPSLSMVAYADETGAGASIASYQDWAHHIGDGTANLNLGTYEYTLTNRTYFDNLGVIEWNNKTVPANSASYINGEGSNTRSVIVNSVDVTSGTLASIEAAMTTAYLTDYTNYFTNTCPDTTSGGDCQAFIQWFFDNGFGGSEADNSSTAEPNDGRKLELDGAEQLTEIWPTGYDASTSFTIPPAN
jgi:hypothetical protein